MFGDASPVAAGSVLHYSANPFFLMSE